MLEIVAIVAHRSAVSSSLPSPSHPPPPPCPQVETASEMRTQIYLLRGEVEEAKRLMMLCSPMTPAYLTLRPAVQVRRGGGEKRRREGKGGASSGVKKADRL